MRHLGQENNANTEIPNHIVTEQQKIETDKNDQTKEEVAENKNIQAAQTAPASTVEDKPRTGTIVNAEQISTVPIPQVSATKISPERAEQITDRKEVTDKLKDGLEPLTVIGHTTLIKPFKTGNYNFMVTCECQWQGKFVTIREANEGAMEHKRARQALDKKNK